MDVIFRGLVRILALTFEVLVKSSVYLLSGFLIAGIVHVALRGRPFGKNLGTRGLRSILSGIGFGVLLPVCSCGVLPLAVAMRKRKASPEATAAFAVATPENSEDTVVLTAGLFGPAFAVFRVIASLVSGVVAGLFVLASEAWGKPESVEEAATPSCQDGCHDTETLTDRPDPVFWAKLKAALRHLLRRDQAGSADTAALSDPAGGEGQAGGAARPEVAVLNARRLAGEVWRFGFREVLDEISWPLLAGLLLSGFLAAALPSDFTRFIPGGVPGQMLLAVLIAPLYLCASASTPLGAVLMAKGMAPAAVLVLFLTGPVTSAPAVLLFRRAFGKKFLFAVVLAALSVSFFMGTLLQVFGRSIFPGGGSELPFLERGVRTWELAAALVFGGPFFLSLARVGLREGGEQVVSAFRGVVPRAVLRGLDRGLDALASLPARRFALLCAGLTVLVWAGFGFTVVPPGSTGFAKTLGKASPARMEQGIHWRLPTPLGSTVIVPAHTLLRLDLGYRSAGIPDPLSEDWIYAGNAWHAIYTTPGDMPEESSFVSGDQNLIEAKCTVHLRISDPFRYSFEVRDGVEPARPLALAVLKGLFGGRPIDAVLSDGRGELEKEAVRELNRALLAAGLPLEAVSFNLLDLHPPQGAVTAFRDVGSASEDRERRKYEARGLAESSLPRARGDAAMRISRARAEAGEKRLAAEGAFHSFAARAEGMRGAPGEVRTRLFWDAIGAAVSGRPVIIAPSYVSHDVIQGGLPSVSPSPAEKAAGSEK
ncbi:MAG: permease [Acidobacteria bacterium]|nr:permease [Acidobacteriota bacterium]